MKNVLIIFSLILIARSSYSQEFTNLYGDYLGQTPPGDTPVVFAPGIVSTIYMEHSTLTFSPDGNEVFWRVEWGPGLDRNLYDKKTWISNKTMNRIGNKWTLPIASPYSDRPVFSHDGKQLYFSDYYVRKEGKTWSEPQSLSLLARFPELKSIYEPSITNDGSLYFSSDTAGLGRIKDHVIYRAKLIDDKYTKLERLPRCINLPDCWNYSPFIARDESYLIFTSNRPGSLNNSADFYISFHDVNEDTWSEPINMGEPINTPGQESSPGLSPDGKYLFYTGPVAGNQGDVFWVSTKIIDRLVAQFSFGRQSIQKQPKKNSETATDIDGNVYHTVTIGSQTWMVEDLKTTRYRNGDSIGTTIPATLDISSEKEPKYQWAYNGDESNVTTYGRLYTWCAATDKRNIAPIGWHVPSKAEWDTLINFLGGEIPAQIKLKEAGTTHWNSPNSDATNESGFSALPGGNRWPCISTSKRCEQCEIEYHPVFEGIGEFTHWWTATEYDTELAWRRVLGNGPIDNTRGYANKKIGWLVRCIKD